MRRLLFAILILGAVAAIGRASAQSDGLTDYYPRRAAPEHHQPLLENDFVLDVFIPAGEVVREARPPIDLPENAQVEWRKPDPEPILISNVGSSEQRALRIELKFLARRAPLEKPLQLPSSWAARGVPGHK